MPLQINAVGSHAKIPKQVKGETNDACSAKRRSYARRHGKGIMAVYEGGFSMVAGGIGG